MGSETCSKSSGESCSLTFRAKKSCLMLNLRVLWASWRNPGVFFGFACSPWAFWVLVGPKRTPNDKVMTVLVYTGPLYGSPWKNFSFPWRFSLQCPKICVLNTGDIVCTYISTDARNALWFMAVRHISYTKPRGENKEYKAYRLWIYLNLRPNGISRIIEHVQKATFVPTGVTNVYNQRNI